MPTITTEIRNLDLPATSFIVSLKAPALLSCLSRLIKAGFLICIYKVISCDSSDDGTGVYIH